jgi:hypothetical protein
METKIQYFILIIVICSFLIILSFSNFVGIFCEPFHAHEDKQTTFLSMAEQNRPENDFIHNAPYYMENYHFINLVDLIYDHIYSVTMNHISKICPSSGNPIEHNGMIKCIDYEKLRRELYLDLYPTIINHVFRPYDITPYNYSILIHIEKIYNTLTIHVIKEIDMFDLENDLLMMIKTQINIPDILATIISKNGIVLDIGRQ